MNKYLEKIAETTYHFPEYNDELNRLARNPDDDYLYLKGKKYVKAVGSGIGRAAAVSGPSMLLGHIVDKKFNVNNNKGLWTALGAGTALGFGSGYKDSLEGNR